MSRTIFYAAAFASALVSTGPADAKRSSRPNPAAGLESINQPVVSRTDYVLDLAGGFDGLADGEAARLDGFLSSLDLGYGDTVYVEGDVGRAAVQAVVGRYGLLVAPGVPATIGRAPDNGVRVVISRTEAYVPGCPDWSRGADTEFASRSSTNYGCAVNGNLSAMIADPNDLLRGRAAAPGGDSRTLTKTVDIYRRLVPTGTSGEVKGEAAGSK